MSVYKRSEIVTNGKDRWNQRTYRLFKSNIYNVYSDHVFLDCLSVWKTDIRQLLGLICAFYRYYFYFNVTKENLKRDKKFKGFIMNAFDIGLIMGVFAMAYVIYTVIKFEVN